MSINDSVKIADQLIQSLNKDCDTITETVDGLEELFVETAVFNYLKEKINTVVEKILFWKIRAEEDEEAQLDFALYQNILSRMNINFAFEEEMIEKLRNRISADLKKIDEVERIKINQSQKAILNRLRICLNKFDSILYDRYCIIMENVGPLLECMNMCKRLDYDAVIEYIRNSRYICSEL